MEVTGSEKQKGSTADAAEIGGGTVREAIIKKVAVKLSDLEAIEICQRSCCRSIASLKQRKKHYLIK